MTTKELYLADMRELLKEAEDKLQSYNSMYISRDTSACDDYQRFVYNGRLEWEGRVFELKERLVDIKHNWGEGWNETQQNFFEQPNERLQVTTRNVVQVQNVNEILVPRNQQFTKTEKNIHYR